MDLGTFSISLTVKDIKASREFYEKLGFKQVHGVEEQNWLIMQSGKAIIGLFQGMFEKNIITFNPTDARAIQKQAKAAGIVPTLEADGNSEGIAHFTLVDPDGNAILFDQHEANDPSMPQKKGKIGWTDLTVPNAEAVRDFYEAVVGWTPDPLSMGDYDDYVMNSPDGDGVAGICHKRGMNADIPSQWMIYITVDKLSERLAKCKELGGKIILERKNDADEVTYAIIEDPAGAVCTLMAG